ncbi:MAG: hypothetical protein QXY80_06750 [Candidatus Jordarchaeales archaeon]
MAFLWWLKKKEKGDEAGEKPVTQEELKESQPESPSVEAKEVKKITVEPEVVGKGILVEWFRSKLGESEFQEAEKRLETLTLQFQVGGTPFHLSKVGVSPFTLKEGRALSYDALIVIPAELEEILASSDTMTSFLEKYKEHLRKPPRIRVQLIKSLEELERKGVMSSKLVRGLLGI